MYTWLREQPKTIISDRIRKHVHRHNKGAEVKGDTLKNNLICVYSTLYVLPKKDITFIFLYFSCSIVIISREPVHGKEPRKYRGIMH